MLLPLYKPQKKRQGPEINLVIAGDVGATKTNLALFNTEGGQLVNVKEAQYPSKEFDSLADMLKVFCSELPLPDAVSIGVAGPVFNNKAILTNLSWEIDGNLLVGQIGIPDIHIINDLEATAWGLAMLTEKDISIIHKGSGLPTGNGAIIAPGTGLGEAGLYWDGVSYHPFATEGGHGDFAPRDELDVELFYFLNEKFGHVSWERLLSGPGIENIYSFLRDKKKKEEPAWLAKEMENEDPAAVISQHTDKAPICGETMELFIRYLARESANLVLKFNATGGLFIGGGISPKILPLFSQNKFYDAYCQSGRLNFLLEKVPLQIILNDKTAMLGAAWYGTNY